VKNGSINSQSTLVDPELERPVPVAPNITSQKKEIITLTANESLPLYYKIIDIITLTTTDESVLYNPIKKIDELLTFAESVGASKNRRAVLKHLLVHKAASPPVIRDETGLKEGPTYRAIDELVKLNYIVWATPTTYNWKRKGYAAGIVALPNFTPEDIIQARTQEVERTKPSAKMVQRAYQLILDEYMDREAPTRSQIIQRIKPRLSGFAVHDIIDWIDQAIELAHKNGTIKVWM